MMQKKKKAYSYEHGVMRTSRATHHQSLEYGIQQKATREDVTGELSRVVCINN